MFIRSKNSFPKRESSSTHWEGVFLFNDFLGYELMCENIKSISS